MIDGLTVKRPGTCLSDLRIDAYFAAELSESDQQLVHEHARGCARCDAVLREREHERTTYLSSGPALALHSTLQSELVNRKRRRIRTLGAISTLSVAAALFLLVLPRAATDQDGTRTKGGPQLGFFVKHGERVRRGTDGERVQPGDQLRFIYSSERTIYLTILSFDPAGQASEYFPATRMAPARQAALPSSVELDATLGRERIYGVFCQKPPPTTALLTALGKSSGHLKAPPNCTLQVVHVIKEPTH